MEIESKWKGCLIHSKRLYKISRMIKFLTTFLTSVFNYFLSTGVDQNLNWPGMKMIYHVKALKKYLVSSTE